MRNLLISVLFLSVMRKSGQVRSRDLSSWRADLTSCGIDFMAAQNALRPKELIMLTDDDYLEDQNAAVERKRRGQRFASMSHEFLSLQAKSIDISKLGRNILAVFLRGFEARLLNGVERFFVKSGAAALDDFRSGDVARRIDFDSQRDVAFHSHAQRHRRIVGAHGLNWLCFPVGPQQGLARKTRHAGAATHARRRCATTASTGCSSGDDANVSLAVKSAGAGFAAATFAFRAGGKTWRRFKIGRRDRLGF
ncbi:MAG TPA: hypothetical protein VNN13_07970, partial [Methylomirabilota bacterium]|nr:hypothetical protein [Methylomirabilota bacterium]